MLYQHEGGDSMDRVSMFTSQPKVSFSHHVAFRSFVAHSRSFRFSAPDSLIRSLPRVLFLTVLFFIISVGPAD